MTRDNSQATAAITTFVDYLDGLGPLVNPSLLEGRIAEPNCRFIIHFSPERAIACSHEECRDLMSIAEIHGCEWQLSNRLKLDSQVEVDMNQNPAEIPGIKFYRLVEEPCKPLLSFANFWR